MSPDEATFRELVEMQLKGDQEFSNQCYDIFIIDLHPRNDEKTDEISTEVLNILDSVDINTALVVAVIIIEAVMIRCENDSQAFCLLSALKHFTHYTFANHLGERYEETVNEILEESDEMIEIDMEKMKEQVVQDFLRQQGRDN